MIVLNPTPAQAAAFDAYREDLEAHGVVVEREGNLARLDVLNVPPRERLAVMAIVMKMGAKAATPGKNGRD